MPARGGRQEKKNVPNDLPPLTSKERAARDADIAEFVRKWAPGPDADSYGNMLRTVNLFEEIEPQRMAA